MAKKLPKQIFVVWNEEGNLPFLDATTKMEDVKCVGAKIGVYDHKNTREFELVEKKSSE